jgi:hypothetical protein
LAAIAGVSQRLNYELWIMNYELWIMNWEVGCRV